MITPIARVGKLRPKEENLLVPGHAHRETEELGFDLAGAFSQAPSSKPAYFRATQRGKRQ